MTAHLWEIEAPARKQMKSFPHSALAILLDQGVTGLTRQIIARSRVRKRARPTSSPFSSRSLIYMLVLVLMPTLITSKEIGVLLTLI